MRKLYKFELDFGRMGEIEALFFAEEKDIEEAIGEPVYLGEALGKHSDIHFDFSKGMIREIPLTEEAADALIKELGWVVSGHDILGSIEEKE